MLEVKLRTAPEIRSVFLRELTGVEERLASMTGPGVAMQLIERLLMDAHGAPLGPEAAWGMSVADRDRAIASLYRHCFDDLIESRLECGGCGKAFEISFSLERLIESLDHDADEAHGTLGISGPEAGGIFRLRDGTRFRPPTTADERLAAEMAPARRADELLRRALVDGAPDGGVDEALRERLEQALEAVAPVISFPMPARCAHCGVEQEADFDIVRYFLAALARERPLLAREVHALARAYHWSFDEIMRLSRGERHTHVELVETERGTLEPDE
ncbi:MAG TPA: hypothetical protein VF989_05640 [Polyangiaceae bacterium]